MVHIRMSCGPRAALELRVAHHCHIVWDLWIIPAPRLQFRYPRDTGAQSSWHPGNKDFSLSVLNKCVNGDGIKLQTDYVTLWLHPYSSGRLRN